MYEYSFDSNCDIPYSPTDYTLLDWNNESLANTCNFDDQQTFSTLKIKAPPTEWDPCDNSFSDYSAWKPYSINPTESNCDYSLYPYNQNSLNDVLRQPEWPDSPGSDCIFKSRDTLTRSPHIPCATETNSYVASSPYLNDCLEDRSPRLSCSDEDSSSYDNAIPIKRPGRPRTSPVQLPKRKPEKRTGKLWEFLRNLLLDKQTCPSLIKWDNYSEGTFKFVQSEKVAQLWGDRKKNDKMNYEKLSRAMRYYYRSEVLLPVSGKRLVYKFGPMATGWKTDNPILS